LTLIILNFLYITYNNNIYHGNYQATKHLNKVIEYILKNVKGKQDQNLLFSNGLSQRIDEF